MDRIKALLSTSVPWFLLLLKNDVKYNTMLETGTYRNAIAEDTALLLRDL